MDYSVDKYNLRQSLQQFQSSALNAANLGKRAIINNSARIFICAFGYNSIGARIGKSMNDSLRIVEDYRIRTINKEDTLILISYSGNEEEVISCHRDALRVGAEVIIITSGGRLNENIMKANKIIHLPTGLTSRTAIPYTMFATLALLSENAIINLGQPLDSIIKSLELPTIDLNAMKLADLSKDKNSVIYSTKGLESAAFAWKLALNTMAKEPVRISLYPELTYGELESWRNNSTEHVFFMHESREISRIVKQIEITKRIVKDKGASISHLNIKDSGVKGLISTIIMGVYLGYYKALNKGIDPTPKPITDDFRKQMGPFI